MRAPGGLTGDRRQGNRRTLLGSRRAEPGMCLLFSRLSGRPRSRSFGSSSTTKTVDDLLVGMSRTMQPSALRRVNRASVRSISWGAQSPAQSSSVATRTAPAAIKVNFAVGNGGALCPARSAAISVATEPWGVASEPTARPIDAA
jgi:hypothetical protein